MSNRQSGACGASRNESFFVPASAHRRPASRLRAALMGATILAGAGALAALMPQQALAQVNINGAHEIVDGDGIGAGTPPSTRDSFWNIGGGLGIGTDIGASGTLTIRNGGRVENTGGQIASGPNSTSDVTVTGAGSEWINSSELIVGTRGAGTLTIGSGGRVENTAGSIGFAPGSVGSVTVTGAGSEWINSESLFIGNSGTGTLTIADGGVVSATSLTIGSNATGTLSFGATAGDAAVAAGTLDTPTITFGPGTGTIVFNHTDNDFELDADISGNGTVRILSGRTILSGNSTYTGNTLLEGGTLTLGSDNALGGSTLRTTGSVVDYVDGVDISNSIVIDSNTTQFQVLTGSATQSGVISQDNGPRPFEKIGDGELILTAANTWTGETTISAGTLTFDGGSLSLAALNYSYIGRNDGDNGTLNIINGGSVSSPFAYIGEDAGSVGTVTVSGAGSVMTNSAETIVGRSGTGTLNIEDGGEVTSTRSWIGRFAGSNGTATVTGADSLWTHSTYLVVGTAGEGELTISDEGRVEVADQGIWIAEVADSTGTITVTGAGSSLVNTGSALRVGNAGSGTLTIENGANVSNTQGILGASAGSNGTATVTGAGSIWTNTGNLFVGNSGTGTLTIDNGGLVENTDGVIGSILGAVGTITVTGAGSQWINSTNLFVGSSGTGTLTIDNGGLVENTDGVIGSILGAVGTVTVTGAGSQWINSGNLFVGSSGNGTLTIENGGRLENAIGRIGLGTGSTSDVTVTGAGSEWINTSSLFVGNSGTGTLAIESGGRVENTVGSIGLNLGSVGTVTVTGAGSEWINSAEVRVGNSGDATLTIENGGLVSATNLTIGGNATGTGTINFGAAAGDAAAAAGTLDTPTITFGPGTGTIVFNHTDNDFELDADISGNGTVRILSGRTILSGNSTYTGNTLLEGGTLTLGSDNALGGSTLRTTGSVVDYADGVDISNAIIIDSNTTQFQVLTGSATQSGVISEDNGPRPFQKIGDGELILTADNTFTGATRVSGGTLTFDGGSLSIAGRLTASAAGSPTASIIARNGAQISTGSNLIIGEVDHGEMLIESGAEVTATDTVSIADVIGSTGLLTIDGAGSLLTASNQVWVGTNDAGAVVITNGGQIDSGAAILGAVGSGVGTVTVDGAHSQWTSSGQFTVGLNRDGELTISGGGEVSNTAGVIASGASSNGSAIVTGAGSSWTNNGTLHVGNSGTGTLTISDGGVVSSNGGLVGAEAGSSGTVTISGTGSTWNNAGALRIGQFGDGTLTISDGGTLTSANSIVAAQVGSSGAATVTGTGSSWTATGYVDVGDRDTGYLTIADGGTVTSATGRIGYFAEGDGHVLVTGADSSWTMSGLLSVGRIGAGALTIADGGEVSNTIGYIGEQAGSTGEATVTGAGSAWINSGALYMGNDGTGTLTISQSGEVSADEVIIAASAGATGTLNIGAAAGDAAAAAGMLDSDTLAFGLGTGRLVFNHTASPGGAGYGFDADISSDAAGDALIRQLAGFTRLTGDSAGYQGDVDVSGGMLSVDGTLGSGNITASVSDGGALTGSGTLDGDVTIEAGGVLAGHSGQTFTITGDLTLQDDGALNVALGAPGGAELFAVGGDLTLDGLLNISDAGGFGPGLYGLITYGGSLTDNGLALGNTPAADLLPGELTIQTSVAGEVNLVSNIGVDLLFWDGDEPANALNGTIDGGDGVWSATSFTFTDADGLVSGPSRPAPGFIVFSGTAGNVTVDDSEGGIGIAGAQFAVDGYLIDGDGITLMGNGDGDAIFRVGNGTGAGAAFTAAIGADLSGDAALIKTDLGTLILTGTNSYAGGTEVRAGTLIGSTASIIGDIANDGVVVFDQAGDASLSQSLSGDGLFRFTGGAEFTLGAGNSYTGGTQVFGSQLVLTASDSAGTGAITLNNSNIAYNEGITVSNTLTFSGTNELQVRSGTATHAGNVTGGGDLGLTGAGTLIFTGNGSAFTGNTIITGNVLMNGSLGGTIDVADGGVLRGFGSLGSTRLLAGSTIAPGNSVGTLTINGDLSFETGSLYEVTVAADGSADLIAVSGAVSISPGAVITVGSAAGMSFSAPTVVLSAAGGVTGSFQFDEAITGLPFITSAVETDGNDVSLVFGRNATPFASLASGGNAASVAQAADTLGSGNPLWQALVWLDAASAPLAFDALNGEIHATHRQLVMDDTIHTRRAVTSRLAAARSEEAGSAWISGHFGGAQMGARTGVARASVDSSGAIFGIDTPVSERARIGVMAGFGENSFNLTGRNASGSTESRSLGVYGAMAAGALGVSAGAIYGWHDLTTSRAVIFPGFDEHQRSSHSADSVQVFSELSLAGPAGFQPFLALAHVRLDTGNFSETGGAAALALDGETRQMTQGTLGTRFSHDWQTGGTNVRFDGSLGWRRVFSGERQYVSGDLSGAPVYFEGNGVGRDAAAIEAGITIEPMSRMSLELGYAGEIGSNARNHGAEFRARWAF